MGARGASGRAPVELALITSERTLAGPAWTVWPSLWPAPRPHRVMPADGAWLTAADDWLPRPGPDTERGAG